MRSAAAARFAARYGLTELLHTPLSDDQCPTCPTTPESVGAHLAAPEATNFNDFSWECPTSPTCPTQFAGVGDENSRPEEWGQATPDEIEDAEPTPSTFVWPNETIPHDVMVGGLLAASRMRSKLVIEKPPSEILWVATGTTYFAASSAVMDPWASGVAHLQQMEALTGFSPVQWESVQRGCLSLLSGWGADMRQLGWTTEDAFGVHPDAPGGAVQCYGLGVLLGDSRVIEMTDKMARIELHDGARQSFTRRLAAGAVPVWTAI